MASPKTRWLDSILMLLIVLQRCAAQSPPIPTFDLQCSRPCDETDCSFHIQCVWDVKPFGELPTNYTLYWESEHGRMANTSCGPKSNGLILRKNYVRQENLSVWVHARNQYGFSESKKLKFNPEDITKPLPPTFTSSDVDPLEIHWSSGCYQLQLSIGRCEVRYRTEEDRDWLKHEDRLHATYSLMDPNPGTVYEFQVRCCCHSSLVSNWSALYRLKSAESAPVGEVDVWRDCGIFPSKDCYLTWKNLTTSQARGLILGYTIHLSYKNGSKAQMNASTASPSSQFVTEDEKWCLMSPLKNVSSVSVTAFNTLGATVPAFLAMPLVTGKKGNDGAVQLEIDEENLIVNWDVPSQFPDGLKEFVLQYKEEGQPAGRGFDWTTVNRTQIVRFTGLFKKYTQYQVSLLQVFNTGEVQHISSISGYFLQKAPSTVPSFKVISIEEVEVTLQWLPPSKQNGQILYYQVGVGSQEVYNVSASPPHSSLSLKLRRLLPAHEYQAWIRAVNAAGPGPSVTTRFITQPHRDSDLPIGSVVGVGFLITAFCVLGFLNCVCREEHKPCPLLPHVCQVPDPRNSHIFKGIKQQNNISLHWICVPIHESHPGIAQLESLEANSEDIHIQRLTDAGKTVRCLSVKRLDDGTEDGVKDGKKRKYGAKDYSKMVDSDEDKEGWSSSEEEPCPSGYEKHFMPTAADLLEM